ncbi:MAG UNVERIFIED_CONTAM: hypothetical protein LVT10_26680 [Anaerolineae bacterium]
MITTNVELETLNPRLRSRLMDEELVHRYKVNAPDYRNSRPQQGTILSDLGLYGSYRFETFEVRRGCRPDESQNLQRALGLAHEFAQRKEGLVDVAGRKRNGQDPPCRRHRQPV